MEASVVEVLAALGGVATRARLLAEVERRHLDAALAAGDLLVLARGRYVLAATDEPARVVGGLGGVLSHRSAALRHGWALARPPERPEVTLAQNRRRRPELLRAAVVHRAWLREDEVVDDGGVRVTSADRTLADCLRTLPPAEALAVADSALRSGVTPGRLVALAQDLCGPGSARARWAAARASDLAAGPFESVLRAIALDVPGLRVRPQVPLYAGATFLGRPDLVDEDLRVVLEADSFAWHGGRAALAHDARRYDELALAGWLVLRFAYEQVLGEGDWVRDALIRAVVLRSSA